jgi:alpha-D-ribose 1-methylphosphonate 5-triphosphate synthase subunit PhnI
MYVATKGGEAAIASAHCLLESRRLPRPGTGIISPEQIVDQMWLAVSRVMTEGSVYDPELAAIAIAQAQGDLLEAVFLLRAYRTTLPRLSVTAPIDTRSMRVERRVSATFKDVPGGQLLGPTFDYTHRLLNFDAPEELDNHPEASDPEASDPEASDPEASDPEASDPEASDIVVDLLAPEGGCRVSDADLEPEPLPRVLDVLDREGLIESNPAPNDDALRHDLTREPLSFPAERPLRLQALCRGDEGFLLSLAYSTQRGFGSTHPFVGEIRIGCVDAVVTPDELGFPVVVGELQVTECEMINQFHGAASIPPQFTRGYGLAFGNCERKSMAMALVDRAMRADELEENLASQAPAQDIEFVLSHSDSLEASGFVQHLKLPHYVDFQSELIMLRGLRNNWEKENEE